MVDRKKFDTDLLHVMAELVSLPVGQQAQVWADFMGAAAGSMMVLKGWTALEAQRWALDRMQEKINELR